MKTGEDSPVLQDAEIITEPASSEENQFVRVMLHFDRDIAVLPDNINSLRITIAGNRVKDAKLEAGTDAQTAVLVLPTNAVTNGIVHVEKSETADVISAVTAAGKKAAAQDFTVEGTTPSGVTLSTVSEEPGRVVKQVDTPWNIRSIAWVALFEEGELVPANENRPGETLDGYVAVHGHEFLQEREKDIARKITETLENNYSAEYSFSCDGDQVSATKDGSDSALDIRIYQYIDINGTRRDRTVSRGNREGPNSYAQTI